MRSSQPPGSLKCTGPRSPGPGARGPALGLRTCLPAPALFSSPAKADDDGGKEPATCESGEDDEEEDEEDEEEEEEDFKPSDGSENEMETEMLDYV